MRHSRRSGKRNEKEALHCARLPVGGIGSCRYFCSWFADDTFFVAKFLVVLSQFAPLARCPAPFPLVRPLPEALSVSRRGRVASEDDFIALHVGNDKPLRLPHFGELAFPCTTSRPGLRWHLHDSLRRAQFPPGYVIGVMPPRWVMA